MKNCALVVGINQYQKLQPLSCAVRDAELMRDFLENQAQFDQVFYFADNSPGIIAPDGSSQSTQPTCANLYSFFHDFFEAPQLGDGDNFWFFFSGHGVRHEGKDYLMPCDGNPRLVEQTGIPIAYATERLRCCGADNVVLFLDACRNEGDKAGLGVGAEMHKGVITFSSCSPSEKSYEIEEIGQGAFTYALLEALHLQGENNCATVERLYRRLQWRVKEINHDYGKPEQIPHGKIEPPSKYHLILLPNYIKPTENDIAALREDAWEAEATGNFKLAKQLWYRVFVLSPTNPRVRQAYERVVIRLAQQPVSTPTPVSTLREEAASKSQATELSKETARESLVQSRLKLFQFEVVTVDAKGRETSRRSGQAKYFVEDLGDGVGLEMVEIPGGTFLMGSPEGEGNEWEKPQHEVTVPPFFLGKYPVTQAQWHAVASLPKVKRDLKLNPSHFKGVDRPVETVSWYDVVEFCNRLSEQMGQQYRLPSEAEWEYACRAGTTTPFYFGETITSDLANYSASDIFAGEPEGQYLGKTTPVGCFLPNAFGLYDLHGNVLEWCADWYKRYKGAPKGGSTWESDCLLPKVIRGGSWCSDPVVCRSAYRFGYDPDSKHDNTDIGFRVARSAPRTP